jgi:hypothetical protein
MGVETILGSVLQEKYVKPSSLSGTVEKIRLNSVTSLFKDIFD